MHLHIISTEIANIHFSYIGLVITHVCLVFAHCNYTCRTPGEGAAAVGWGEEGIISLLFAGESEKQMERERKRGKS